MRRTRRAVLDRGKPTRRQVLNDLFFALGLAALAVLMLEFSRSLGALWNAPHPLPVSFAFMVLPCLLLTFRRLYPTVTLVAVFAVITVVSLVAPYLNGQLISQLLTFFAMYSALAWSKHRSWVWAIILVFVGGNFIGLAVGIFNGEAQRALYSLGPIPPVDSPLLPALVAFVALRYMSDLLWTMVAVLSGVLAYNAARQTRIVEEQAAFIREQSAQLADQAVMDERLRLARELHDVIAHHVAGVGVQAGAARHVLERKGLTDSSEDMVKEVLAGIEMSSRQSVEELRHLLGMLRSRYNTVPDSSVPAEAQMPLGAGDEANDRLAGPGLAQIPALCSTAPGLRVAFTEVEDPAALLSCVSASVGLALYRVVQESLANTRRHSTAEEVSVVLRSGVDAGPWVEVEVIDDGLPRPDAEPSTGFGLQGMRERAALHQGLVDVGPRVTGGWRTRVRYPITPAIQGATAVSRTESPSRREAEPSGEHV